MTIRVVNKYYYDGDDMVYIGRPSPLSNPYHSKPSKFDPKNLYKTDSVEESIEKFKKYLLLKIPNLRMFSQWMEFQDPLLLDNL